MQLNPEKFPYQIPQFHVAPTIHLLCTQWLQDSAMVGIEALTQKSIGGPGEAKKRWK